MLSKADGNIFYSPLSIHVLMFMASIGAVSNTFDEILATIHLNKSNDLLEAYKELLNNLMVSTPVICIFIFQDTYFQCVNIIHSYLYSCIL